MIKKTKEEGSPVCLPPVQTLTMKMIVYVDVNLVKKCFALFTSMRPALVSH